MGTEIKETVCKSILTPTGGYLSGFTHSLQPYVGCVFGCSYCYVQALPRHRFHGGQWGKYVDAKTNAAEVLAVELEKQATRGNRLRIFMSSATDPYQGAEAHHRISRQCLEVLADIPPGLLVVQTRGPLVRRDFDILKRIEPCVLSMTVETNDEAVKRAVTPGTPSFAHRLKTMQSAMDTGLKVQAAVSPMLPNDPEVFARILDSHCHRVVVDTYFDGDGANGSRTNGLGIGTLYQEKGYSHWYHRSAHSQLLRHLRDTMGTERVVFSQEGFNKAVQLVEPECESPRR